MPRSVSTLSAGKQITLQSTVQVPKGEALTRGGARPGEDVWVSGTLGDAAMAKLVLDNMGFTAYSVNPVAYNEIANLVAQLFESRRERDIRVISRMAGIAGD